jgi:hypothetical protein
MSSLGTERNRRISEPAHSHRSSSYLKRLG